MFNELKVKRLTETAKLPTRNCKTDAGLDLYADLEHSVCLYPGNRKLIPTGIAISLPEHVITINGMEFVYEAQLRPRSGLALESGLSIVNSPATIDVGYRGQIRALLLNTGDHGIHIKPGDKIVQMIIGLVALPNIIEVDELESTERNTAGFGSSGV